MTELPEVATVERQGSEVVVMGTGDLVNVVILTLAAAGVSARDVQLDSGTLEDAFVKLTTATSEGPQHDQSSGAAARGGAARRVWQDGSQRGAAGLENADRVGLRVGLPVLLVVIFGEVPSFNSWR